MEDKRYLVPRRRVAAPYAAGSESDAATRESPAGLEPLLNAVRAGDRAALNDLYSMVYTELRALAHRQRRGWLDNETLNTTALVHEAYLKLAGQRRLEVSTREHFFALAATAIRHIVSNYARDRRAQKRGGNIRKVPLSDLLADGTGVLPLSEEHLDVLIALDEALEKLDRTNARQRRIVECRFFAGMSAEETAAALGISPRTVKRDWAVAQAWLYREMKDRR